MKKQLVLAVLGIVFVIAFFVFGRTAAEKKPAAPASHAAHTDVFDITHFIADAKQKLSNNQNLALSKLENSVSRGDVMNQQIDAYNKLAAFWKDSARVFEPYAFYLSEVAKFEKHCK